MESRSVTTSEAPRADTSRYKRIAKIALIGLVMGAALVAHRMGWLDHFGAAAQCKQMLVDLGPWGYLAFVVAFSIIQPFGVPGTVFVIAASLIWPWPVALTLSTVGTMGASVVGFSFARFVARDTVAKLIPARFKRYDDALERRAFATVATLRLLFWMQPLLHAFFGISKVRFWTHFWGSLAGYAVPLIVLTFFGERLLAFFR